MHNKQQMIKIYTFKFSAFFARSSAFNFPLCVCQQQAELFFSLPVYQEEQQTVSCAKTNNIRVIVHTNKTKI